MAPMTLIVMLVCKPFVVKFVIALAFFKINNARKNAFLCVDK